MRKLMSFILLAAGLSFGAFAYFPASSDREEQLATVTAILAGDAKRVPETTGALRDFSPKHEMRIAPRTAPASGQTTIAKADGVPPPAVPTVPASQQQAAAASANASANSATNGAALNGWQAVVTTENVPAGVTSSKPGDMHARYELVLDLQRELKRAGCYGGTLSGSWNANTKRAMSTFMDRVNASLPLEEPDYILLMLIKGRPAASCVTCPMGQSLTDGRCVPVPVVAQNQAPAPKPASKKQAVPAPEKPGFRTVTAQAEPDTRRAQPVQPQPAPLPGRMSVGGPKLEIAAPAVTRAEPARSAPIAPALPTVEARTAALVDSDDTGPAEQPATPAEPEGTVSPAVPAAAAGYPGTKSGRTAASPPAANSPVTIVPAPRRAERPVARPQKVYKRRYNTRSVQSLFQHPLGRL